MADGIVRIVVEDNAVKSADNFKKLDRQLEKTGDEAESTSKSFVSLKGTLGAIGVGIAVEGFRRLSFALVDAASEAEETQNKFNTAFRGIREDAELTAEALSDGFNISRQSAKALLADTGDILKGFGFTSLAALDLSDKIQRLASDLTSYNNFAGGTAEASRIVTKALLGERDALISLGTKINDVDLKQFAEDQELVYDEMTRLQKATLTYSLILKQNQDAIGDTARSQDSYVNTSRDLDAAFQDLSAVLGERLLPTFTAFKDTLTDVVNTITDFANPVKQVNKEIEITRSVILGLVDDIESGNTGFLDGIIGPSAEKRLQLFQNKLGDLKRRRAELLNQDFYGNSLDAAEEAAVVSDALVPAVSATNDKVKELGASLASLGDFGGVATERVKTGLEDINIGSILTKLEDGQRDINSIAEGGVSGLAGGLADILVNPFKEGENAVRRFGLVALDIIKDVAVQIVKNQLVGLFTSFIPTFGGGATTPSVTPNAKGNAFSGGNVQAFADGGVVGGPTFFPMANGGTGLMGEAGAEAIMPLKRTGQGRLGVEASGLSPTVNIYNQSNSSIETVSRPDGETDVFIRQVNSVLSSQRSDGAFSAALGRQRASGVQAG